MMDYCRQTRQMFRRTVVVTSSFLETMLQLPIGSALGMRHWLKKLLSTSEVCFIN